MSELILTEEERAANTWLELSDKTIADTTRHVGLIFKNASINTHIKDVDRPLVISAAMHICLEFASSKNLDKYSFTFEDLQFNDEILGSYKLTIEKINNEKEHS